MSQAESSNVGDRYKIKDQAGLICPIVKILLAEPVIVKKISSLAIDKICLFVDFGVVLSMIKFSHV
jgi:hypothetical protein